MPSASAATASSSPRERLRVYLCDDGGTLQKRSDPDPARAAKARERGAALESLCRHTGAVYLTRRRNERAKAGNLNEALKRTGGDLVLVLDADHVLTEDILENTVGLFQRDVALFLVQTPHFFVSADPVEKNCASSARCRARTRCSTGRSSTGSTSGTRRSSAARLR